MKTKAKGNRIVRKAKTELKKIYDLLGNVESSNIYAKEKDLFKLFDLCCIRPGNVLFIQITTNTPHTHYKFQEFVDRFGNEHVWISQAVWKDYIGWDVYHYYPNTRKEKNHVFK